VLVKGLPLAYNRDLQEDKAALFDAFDTIAGCLAVAAPLVRQTKLRRDVIAAKLEDGFLDATTLMEALVARGVPMRSAHEAVGKLVRLAEQCGRKLADLPAEAFESVQPGLAVAVYGVLGARNALAAFRSFGSTAPAEVAKQLAFWRQRLAPDGPGTAADGK
jgi:argininosuccinate lyase